MAKFDPATDIPSLDGKVILLTGGTAGLGRETLVTLAKHNPAKIFFTGRNAASAEKTITELKQNAPNVAVKFISCDQSSLASVQAAAKQFLQESDRLDLLFCVAGIMALPPGLTKDGYEQQFGVNHLAHALLIKLLLPTLLHTAEQRSSDVRIVNYASLGMMFARSLPLDKFKTTCDTWPLGPWQRYGWSKVSNILYAKQLAERYPSILSASLQPGVINTGLVDNVSLGNKLFIYATTLGQMVSVDEGIKNGLWVATAKRDEVTNGEFWEPVGKVGRKSAVSASEEIGTQLWDWTQKELLAYS